jgi:hypothetical protein
MLIYTHGASSIALITSSLITFRKNAADVAQTSLWNQNLKGIRSSASTKLNILNDRCLIGFDALCALRVLFRLRGGGGALRCGRAHAWSSCRFSTAFGPNHDRYARGTAGEQQNSPDTRDRSHHPRAPTSTRKSVPIYYPSPFSTGRVESSSQSIYCTCPS